MRAIKAVVVAILFIMVPHVEPQAEAGVESESAGTKSTEGNRKVGPKERAVQTNGGFVWSVPASTTGGELDSASDHLSTDGYAWSARSRG